MFPQIIEIETEPFDFTTSIYKLFSCLQMFNVRIFDPSRWHVYLRRPSLNQHFRENQDAAVPEMPNPSFWGKSVYLSNCGTHFSIPIDLPTTCVSFFFNRPNALCELTTMRAAGCSFRGVYNGRKEKTRTGGFATKQCNACIQNGGQLSNGNERRE